MRLIDADSLQMALIEEKQKESDADEFWVYGMNRASHVVERQPTIGEWIPCSERMPEEKKVKKNSDYWHSLKATYCKNTDEIFVSETVLVSVIGYFNRKPRVCEGHTINGVFHCGICGCDEAVAWMPLPTPWKGEA